MSPDPSLTLPPSEEVGAGGTVAIGGITYDDSFAASNPGAMYLSMTATGSLTAHDSKGAIVSGSGSNTITLGVGYADVTAVLGSLGYTAARAPDTIRFDLWDQAGIETTGSIPVTVTSGSATETWTGAVSSDWNTPGNWSGGAVPASGDTAVVPGGTPNVATLSDATIIGETISLTNENGAVNQPSLNLNDVTLGAGTLLQTLLEPMSADVGTVNVGGTLTVGSGATVEPQAGSYLSLGGTGTVVNDGAILVSTSSDDSQNGVGTSSLVNNGLIEGNGAHATLGLNSTITNAGTIEVANGSHLSFTGTIAGGSVVFSGAGLWSLTDPAVFANGAAIIGFGAGDSIEVTEADGLAFANGTLDLTNGGSVVQALPFSGSYGLGNFELTQFLGPFGATPAFVTYAPDGGFGGSGNPDIAAPATTSVAQGGTLALGSVSVMDASNITISDASGTLYMDGASGSGTTSLNASGTPSQLNADLASLQYVPAAGATSDTISILVNGSSPQNPYHDSETTRDIPLAIAGGGGPTVHEPTSETVAAGATQAVSGSYADSFAAGNPGLMFLGITDTSGALTATDAAGNAVTGSGSNSICLNTDFVDLNAILASLRYTAGASPGSDSIGFDIWNQAGTETTAATAVTIDPPGLAVAAAQASIGVSADFVAATASSTGRTMANAAISGSANALLLSDLDNHPTGAATLRAMATGSS